MGTYTIYVDHILTSGKISVDSEHKQLSSWTFFIFFFLLSFAFIPSKGKNNTPNSFIMNELHFFLPLKIAFFEFSL